jgi:oligoribonuclease NrnB/cAMP/cGMP phosphodiesterase (DHH superfamily)
MTHHHLQTVILYHGKCADGFGSAYAVWKKFGDTVEYIPVKHGGPLPEKMEGRDIYLIDFCFPEEEMARLAHTARSITVLDHHEGVRKVAESFPGVFDANRSGASIAWNYFHPDTPMPRLLAYVEDGDLYRYALPETRDVFSYLTVLPYEFPVWDNLAHTLEDDSRRSAFLQKAENYTEYFKLLADLCVDGAKKVLFEGYECMFANSHPSMTMKSYVGHQLSTKFPPFALIVTAHPTGFGVSIRGDGSVDVSKIAEKYGGSGHPNSSGFFIEAGSPLPWKEIIEGS